jgi:hypothetical protein
LARLRIELRTKAVFAQPVKDPVRQREVHVADEVAVVCNQRMKRTVP